jgi:hypothetical protein
LIERRGSSSREGEGMERRDGTGHRRIIYVLGALIAVEIWLLYHLAVPVMLGVQLKDVLTATSRDGNVSYILGRGANRLSIQSRKAMVFISREGFYEIESTGDHEILITGYKAASKFGRTITIGTDAGRPVVPLAVRSPRPDIPVQHWRNASDSVLASIDGVGGATFATITTRVARITTAQNLSPSYQVVLADSPVPMTLTLPSARGFPGRNFVVKNVGQGAVTLKPRPTETIDGSRDVLAPRQYDVRHVMSDGVNWLVL